jgi:seryl-tRNA synthetase
MDGNSPDVAGLHSQDLLLPGAAAGVYGRGPVLDDLIDRLETRITSLGRTEGTEVMRFPPVVDRRTAERCGYLHSFPQLLGTVHTFRGDQRQHARLLEEVEAGANWGHHQTLSDLVLTPAACYAVYPRVAGVLPATGRRIDVESWCFRHEPSLAPERMRAFRMREFVRAGEPAAVLAWRDGWLERGQTFLRALGLAPVLAPANDPFFGAGARFMAARQRAQDLKFELLAPAGGDRPAAVMSCNYHLDHFGEAFGIRAAGGGVAHTACVGFGLERLALALLLAHGAAVARWPAPVREALWGPRAGGAGG